METQPVLSYKKLLQLTGEGIIHPEEFKILIVDDNAFDSELVLRELKNQSLIQFTSKVVSNKEDYEEALKTYLPDVVYCDYYISADFSAISAIRVLKKDYPEVPFVLVTGALNEDATSICIYEGIDDYVLKSRMERLPLSLINACNKRKIELEKKQVFEKLVKSETEIRNFAKHINQLLEDERAHIAREIHDELGQQLVGIKFGLSAFKKLQNEDPSFEKWISAIKKDVDDSIQSMRKIATELRPGILDTLGLIPSIKWLVTEFEKKNGIKCNLNINVSSQKFEKNLSTCFFRICQESLTNISKHAEANEITIDVSQHFNKLEMNISDNGKGMEGDRLNNPFSMGLLGMRERAKIINASLLIKSVKNEGTAVNIKANLN